MASPGPNPRASSTIALAFPGCTSTAWAAGESPSPAPKNTRHARSASRFAAAFKNDRLASRALRPLHNAARSEPGCSEAETDTARIPSRFPASSGRGDFGEENGREVGGREEVWRTVRDFRQAACVTVARRSKAVNTANRTSLAFIFLRYLLVYYSTYQTTDGLPVPFTAIL